NALRHGIGQTTDAGSLQIKAMRQPETLVLTVSDNGGGLPVHWQLKTSSGIGLANTAARLQQLYGENHRFDIHNRDEGGVEVEIVVPARTAD
ncbi:MAG: sensor histidine kinase, partial [Acidobacteria bacterium]